MNLDQHELERQANRLDLVSRWADDLAHEIKNPLHAMVINLELVKRRAGAGDPGLLIERAEVVESELHRVHELVDSLLKLVRPWPEAGAATVQEVFTALLPVFAARARIRQVEYRHDPGTAIVAMSPGDLAQVLANLVDNAIDATAEGGRVSTAVAVKEHRARITVRDTGTGLADPGAADGAAADGVATEPAAASSPETRSSGRQGLGLAVTRALVERVGGSLRLENGSGGGAEATVTLPCTGSA